MQGREDHSGDVERYHHVGDQLQGLLPAQPFEEDRHELEEEHRGVEHDAPGYLEHHRVRIPPEDRMPDVPGLTEVEEQADDDKQVAEKGGQDRWAHQGFQAAIPGDVD